MIKAVLLDVGGTLIKDVFFSIFLGKASRLREGVKENIPILAKKYELYLATRYPLSWQQEFLKYFNLEKFIKIIAENPPAQKPDPQFFIWLLDKIKKSPSEAIMVGDSLEVDIMPAKSLGIKTILISAIKSDLPDWSVSDFPKAADILLKL